MTNELDQIAMSAALDRIRQLECETVPRAVADRLAEAVKIALAQTQRSRGVTHKDDSRIGNAHSVLAAALNEYRKVVKS